MAERKACERCQRTFTAQARRPSEVKCADCRLFCECGRPKALYARTCRACYAPPLRRRRLCLGCGCEFTMSRNGKNKGLYCTRECAFKNAPYYNRAKKPTPPAKPLPRCEECGRQCHAYGAKTCCDQCREARYERRVRARQCVDCGVATIGERCATCHAIRCREMKAAGMGIEKCIVCGGSKAATRVLYCSKECSHAMNKLSHLWRGLEPAHARPIIETAAVLKRLNQVAYRAYGGTLPIRLKESEA
jgi:hypothetical protein